MFRIFVSRPHQQDRVRCCAAHSTTDNLKEQSEGSTGTETRSWSPIRLQTLKAGSHRNLTKCSGSACRPPVPYENTSASYGWTKQWVLQCITITEWFKWTSNDDVIVTCVWYTWVSLCHSVWMVEGEKSKIGCALSLLTLEKACLQELVGEEGECIYSFSESDWVPSKQPSEKKWQ